MRSLPRPHFRQHLAAALLLLAWAGMAQAAPACDAKAAGSRAYRQASALVERLPDYRAWAASHQQPAVFGMPVDGQVRFGGRCYWSVSVYLDMGDRLGLWTVFLVHLGSGDILVDDAASEAPLSLQAWRHKYRTLPDPSQGKPERAPSRP
ncbi:hypothetical protein [Roseateles flavus]|uniref:Uncharacterized protein n=1 Tax=Roseateles flavus TaxID=3149041 RepID=A0ABV0G8D0_9BURK